MNNVSSVIVLTTLSLGVASSAQAAVLTSGILAELPMIPLERSLVPCDRTVHASTGFVHTVAQAPQIEPSFDLANALIRGLAVANRTGEIAYYSPLSLQVQDVVRGLRRGALLSSASSRAGVPLVTVERLLSLGHLKREPSSLATLPAYSSPLPSSSSVGMPRVLANAIVRGLLVANRNGEIGYKAPLSYKVQNVVRGLRRGEPLPFATRRAQVPSPVVARLLHLGNYEAQVD
ncbi:MAG TPA: hypothetical protein V6D19_19870 [Stenomitos sp.]